jgi:hypothetical protein
MLAVAKSASQQVSNPRPSIVSDGLQCDCNATRATLPNRYQRCGALQRVRKQKQPQVIRLRLLLMSEADGIRTRNPRIDSPGIALFKDVSAT